MNPISDAAPSLNGHHGEVRTAEPDTLPIVEPRQVEQARVVVLLVGGAEVPRRSIEALDASPFDWSGLATRLDKITDPDKRPIALEKWLANHQNRPADQSLMRRALQIAAESPPEDMPGAVVPPPFSLELISTLKFFEETYRLDFLAKGILVRDQPCVFGGPQKSLKTSILIDLAISLASGTPFLGRFSIPEPVPVALISGESGKAVIQANAKQICIERELPYAMAGSVHWGFIVPKLSNAEHLAVLRKTIGDLGIKAILLDPLYLMLVTGAAEVDPKDMFQMGPLLSDVAGACIEAGATPVLCHHFVKKRDDPFGPPDMGELAYAGIGQFMRQWMLTSRRERYNAESGLHPLHFHYGGSAGHSGELHLDIETGRIDDELKGRRWSVTVLTPGEGIAARQERAKAEKERLAGEKLAAEEEKKSRKLDLHAEKIFAALAHLGGVQTMKSIRAAAALSGDDAGAAMFLLTTANRVRQAMTNVKTGRSTREVEGYELVPPPGIQPNLALTGSNRE